MYLSLMWSVTFPCLTTSLSSAILSRLGLLEVPTTYLGSLGYFFSRGSRLCSLLSLVPYPKHVHFAFLTLPYEY
jgi:hypothetical protein